MAGGNPNEGERGHDEGVIDFLDPDLFDLPEEQKAEWKAALTYEMRPLSVDDLDKGFLETLSFLTAVDLTVEEAALIFLKMTNSTTFVCVLKDRVIGTGTLIIEQKFIHSGGKVAHIEDVAIHGDYQGMGVGTNLMQYLEEQARNEGCYKIILDTKAIEFYEKQGYTNRETQMRKDL